MAEIKLKVLTSCVATALCIGYVVSGACAHHDPNWLGIAAGFATAFFLTTLRLMLIENLMMIKAVRE